MNLAEMSMFNLFLTKFVGDIRSLLVKDYVVGFSGYMFNLAHVALAYLFLFFNYQTNQKNAYIKGNCTSLTH